MRLTPNANNQRTFSLSIKNRHPWEWNDINSWIETMRFQESEKVNRNIQTILRKWVSEINPNRKVSIFILFFRNFHLFGCFTHVIHNSMFRRKMSQTRSPLSMQMHRYTFWNHLWLRWDSWYQENTDQSKRRPWCCQHSVRWFIY